jgi:SAM-dependent methyltransferase
VSSWKKRDVADSYVDGVRASIPLVAEQIDLMHRLIDATLPSVEAVVDLGCGDGALAASVLARHPSARACLIDFSAAMLDRARERFRASTSAVSLLRLDLSDRDWTQHLTLNREPDLIVSGFAIHHLDDARKQELYREVFDLLKPGGLFINLEHVAPASALGRRLFDELFIDRLYAQAAASDPSIGREQIALRYEEREDQHDNILAAVEAQCEWLRAAGFVDVDCYFRLLELALLAGRKASRR